MTKLNKLLFVHIPKTGGLSLNLALANIFSQEKSIRFGDDKTKENFRNKLSTSELLNYDYITGHFPLQTFRNKGILYPAVTIIRNPVDRLLSMYNYLRQSKHPDHQNLKFKNINNFVDYILENDIYDNIQCRYIGGERTYNTTVKLIKNELIYVVPLDKFNDINTTLDRLLGKPLKISHINKSDKKQSQTQDKFVIENKLKKCWEEDMNFYVSVMNNYSQNKQVFLDKLDVF